MVLHDVIQGSVLRAFLSAQRGSRVSVAAGADQKKTTSFTS